METPYSDEPEESQEAPVEIYSKWAILGFSIFFSTLFGGVLLFINLRNVGYKRKSYSILAFSFFYTFLGSIIGNMASPYLFAPFCVNLIGGMILATSFFNRYFPDNDYYPKPIWGALAVSVIISLSLFLIMYYSGSFPELDKMLSKK